VEESSSSGEQVTGVGVAPLPPEGGPEEPDVLPVVGPEEPDVLPVVGPPEGEPVEAAGGGPPEGLPGGVATVLLVEPAWAAGVVILEERSVIEELEELEDLEDRDAAVGTAPLEEPEEPEELEELLLDAGAAPPPPPPRTTLEDAVALGFGAGTNFGPDCCCAPRMMTATNNTTAMAASSQFIKAVPGVCGCIVVSIHAYLEINFPSQSIRTHENCKVNTAFLLQTHTSEY
jgi:hypothetical protein